MKRDQKLVINGYVIPGGVSRVAVAAAVDLIKRNPGVKQLDVQKHAVLFSGLNDSTAGWITGPSGKGPLGHLWDRRKEDVYRCYPNEHTALFNLDPVQLAISICKRQMAESIKVKPGDLVEVRTYKGLENGTLVGFRLFGGWQFEQFSKGNLASSLFTDPSFLDNPQIWGYGIPAVWCVVNTSSGLSDSPAVLVRAMPTVA